MPVKKRLAKVRQNRITPGAIAAFRAGDRKDLAEALELPPWHVSPLDVERGADCPWPRNSAGAVTWERALELRAELEAASGKAP